MAMGSPGGQSGDWFRHRTGRLMICRCTPRPFPYELTGAAAKTATDAAVLRDAFRKHNYHLRNKSKNDDEFWNLSLSINEDENPPVSQDLINRLPTEILGQILSDVYRSTETSNDICSCSRPNTPYKTTRLRSLVHRVVDTFAIRLTCSRWHSWALESILSGAVENEHIELDISDLATLKNKMQFPVGGIGTRLAWDFPFLTLSGITLYLGNPGEVANLILVVEMLGQEKFHGGEYYRIFRGLSFWDLGFIYRDVLPQAPWHAHDLLLLDIISHFSAMPLVTRVQFPATILAAVPHGYWAPVLEGLVRHSDRLSMREFLIINHAPLTPYGIPCDDVFTLPSPPPKGNHLNLEELFEARHFAMPVDIDIDKHCGERHSSISFGPERYWKRLRYLNLSLKGTSPNGSQNWRIDDAFLAKISCCNPAILVSVEINGGLASSLTINGLLKLVEPSRGTLKRLIFRPAVPDPRTRYERKDGVAHHCRVLTAVSSFPQLEELELHVSCLDLFDPNSRHTWKLALKRRWKIVVKRKNDWSMEFCHNWIAHENTENHPLSPTNSKGLKSGSLRLLLESPRAARRRLLSRELAELEILQNKFLAVRKMRKSIDQVRAPVVDQGQNTRMVRQELREAQRDLENKLREVAEKWQLEIHMENIRIKGSNMSVVFRPLELPPMVEVRTVNYDCVTLKEDVVSVNEADFLKKIEGSFIICS